MIVMKNDFSNSEKEPSLKSLSIIMKEVALESKQKSKECNLKLAETVQKEIKRLELKYNF
jgi:hypothetical protein